MPVNKTISIITVCFNSAKTIRQTIESVLNQTYSNIEYIIVDGKSKDNTLEIIKEYEQCFSDKGISYRYISEPDKSIYDALNKGIQLASGEWIGIIHSDDWYELDACENLFSDSKCIGFDLIYGLVRVINSDGLPHSVEQIMFEELITDPMQHQGVFVKRYLHHEIGLYSMKYEIASDYDFLLKCMLAKKNAKFIPSIVANFSRCGISNMNSSAHISILETYKILYTNKIISKAKLVLVGYGKFMMYFLINKLRKFKTF